MAAASILAKLARRHGGKLLDGAIGKALNASGADGGSKGTLLSGIAGIALVRIATRSVPGAIVVGGGLLAKTLYDRRKAKRPAKSKSIKPKPPKQ
jgi:hypothetical protein